MGDLNSSAGAAIVRTITGETVAIETIAATSLRNLPDQPYPLPA